MGCSDSILPLIKILIFLDAVMIFKILLVTIQVLTFVNYQLSHWSKSNNSIITINKQINNFLHGWEKDKYRSRLFIQLIKFRVFLQDSDVISVSIYRMYGSTENLFLYSWVKEFMTNKRPTTQSSLWHYNYLHLQWMLTAHYHSQVTSRWQVCWRLFWFIMHVTQGALVHIKSHSAVYQKWTGTARHLGKQGFVWSRELQGNWFTSGDII